MAADDQILTVYLAHPAFTEQQRRFKEDLLTGLRRNLSDMGVAHRVAIIDPFSFSPNIEGNPEAKVRFSREIKETCLELLMSCDLILVVTDDDDTGTAFEAGYAHSLDIPIILIAKGSCLSANAMLLGAALERFESVLEDRRLEALASRLTLLLESKDRPRIVT